MNLAFYSSLFLIIYHQVTTWIPLFPWNDVQKYSRRELLLESGINGVLMGIGSYCLFQGGTGAGYWYPVVYYPFLFVGECVDWWIPYFSKSFAERRKIWDYDAHFSRTLKIIPHQEGKRTPDANHTVLHLITLLTIALVYIDRFWS